MWEKLKNLFQSVKREVRVWRIVMKDARTPKTAKILIGAALAYLISPIEIIPDFIPVIGYLDDIVIVTILIMIAMQMIPHEVVSEAREEASSGTH